MGISGGDYPTQLIPAHAIELNLCYGLCSILWQ